jgi:non-ribosomal peptide synthase protein (TIGR01720 family)
MLRAGFFMLGADRPNLLFLDVHHLVVDGVSWRILFNDLATACEQVLAGNAVRLPARSTSFREWAMRLQQAAADEALLSEATYWTDSARHATGALPVDHVRGENRVDTAESVVVELSEPETRQLLQQVPAVYRTQINDVLLTALALTLSEWTGRPQVLVELEGHGREEIFDDLDLSRTVGWFTTAAPVLLEVPESRDSLASLRVVKRQLLGMARRGLEYGLLRRWGPPALREQLQAMPAAAISFNYLGQWDNLGQGTGTGVLSPSERSLQACQAVAELRTHLIDVTGLVTGGRLHMEWAFSNQLHRRDTVLNWAERYLGLLKEFIRTQDVST